MDAQEIIEEAEAMLSAIAGPDLAGHPVYVVPQSRVCPELGGDTGAVSGWTAIHADLFYRDIIGARWKGRGAALVVADGDSGDRDATRSQILSTAVHEMGHRIADGLFGDPMGEQDARSLAQSAGSWLRSLKPEDLLCDPSIALAHSPKWMAVTLHLAVRAAVRGYPVSPAAALSYGFAPHVPAMLVESEAIVDITGNPRARLEGERLGRSDITPPDFTRIWFAAWSAAVPAERGEG